MSGPEVLRYAFAAWFHIAIKQAGQRKPREGLL
jgi:hypothetical protein